MGPDIRAFVCHEDRRITDQPNPALGGVGTQVPPLAAKHELLELVVADGISPLGAQVSTCLLLVASERRLPLSPTLPGMAIAGSAVQRVVGQPIGAFAAQRRERRSVVRAFSKACVGFAKCSG